MYYLRVHGTSSYSIEFSLFCCLLARFEGFNAYMWAMWFSRKRWSKLHKRDSPKRPEEAVRAVWNRQLIRAEKKEKEKNKTNPILPQPHRQHQSLHPCRPLQCPRAHGPILRRVALVSRVQTGPGRP